MGRLAAKKLITFNALAPPLGDAARLILRWINEVLSLINRIWTRNKSGVRKLTILPLTAFPPANDPFTMIVAYALEVASL